jgi:hypothetical protein
MEVPHQYPYNPPAWAILLSFGSGFLWMASHWLRWGYLPTGLSLWFSLIGLIPIALALILGVRWIWVERFLLLDHDRMTLPIGLFGMQTAKIEYRSIRRIWQQYIRPYEYRFVLKVATEEQVFTIMPAFLPDNESYRALEEFLNRKFHENTRPKTSQETTWR